MTWFPGHSFQDPGIGEVAEEHDMAFGEAVGVPAEGQVAAPGQDVGGCGRWHAAFPSFRQFDQQAFIEQA